MRFDFDPERGLVLVQAEVMGPLKSIILRLALDTGATATLISTEPLMTAGYEPSGSSERIQITTGSGIERVPRVWVRKVSALGQERQDFPVLAHALPPDVSVDGLLGLDFLRGRELTVDFRRGRLRLR